MFQVLGIFFDICHAVTGLRDALVDVSGNPDINSQSVGAGARWVRGSKMFGKDERVNSDYEHDTGLSGVNAHFESHDPLKITKIVG